jgi:hypothetical protein
MNARELAYNRKMRLPFAVVIAVVLAARSAAGQSAPPDSSPPAPTSPATPPAVATPTPAAPPPPARAGVMANRWGLMVGLGFQALKSSDDGSGENIAFATYEIGGRFRIIPSIEVALTIAAGANHDDSYSGLWADFRYRFLAERPWNIYAYLGFGAGSAAGKNASDDETHGRGSLRLGGGVERRFDVFSLSAELRVLAFGQNSQSPVLVPPTPSSELAHDGLSGLGLVVGATYYF